MAQEIINTGAAANDGTGDPLRTAFIKTDNNFDQIWAAGPVGTNVRISGNTITTLTVNTDLALSPNGAANVRLNNNTIPGANNTWYLGSASNRWRGIYVNSVDAGNITVSGSLAVPGDLTVGGNLTVEGDTIQIGNIVTDTKTIQLSNTAANGAQANGSGITVGANDNIATFLYNSAGNVWTTNIGANVTGNVTANYFIGNGALLTGVTSYSNANVAAYLPTYGGNLLANTVEFTGELLVARRIVVGTLPSGNIEILDDTSGNGPALKTPGGSGLDMVIEPSGNLYLNADGGEVIVSDQTPSVDANSGALKVLGGIGVNGNINAGGNIAAAGWTGNLIPSANATYSLGNSTNYWSNLWVANNTIYIGGVPLGISAGNVLTVAGNAVLTTGSNTTVSTTGNITANYFFGNGSQLTGLSAGYSDSNVSAFLAAFGSNAIVTTGNATVGNLITGNGDSLILGNTSSRIRQNGSNATMALSGSVTLTPDTSASALNGVVIGGSGYLLAPNGSRNAELNYGGGSGTMGIYTINIYGNTTTAITNGGANGVGNIGANASNRFNTAFLTAVDASGNVTANYFIGNGSQLTDVNAVTVDVTDTNGLTTVYYPTFVENRTTTQIARADVDLTYRTDDNLLTVGNVSVTGNISANTAGFAIGYRDIPQVAFTGNATIATADAGKHFYSTQSTDYILTIANNASQGFQTGAAITVINQGTGNITLAQGSGVTLYLTGNATSGNRTVTTFGMATLIKVATDTWFVSGAGVI